MKSSVYIETSVVGYLAMRPSHDTLVASNQKLTLEWWADQRPGYNVFVSEAVIAECSAGDPVAAAERLEFLKDVPSLEVTPEARELAGLLLDNVPLPEKARVDALHIATAAVQKMSYLLTWNCTHIANSELRPKIGAVCDAYGVSSPSIVTPPDLMED